MISNVVAMFTQKLGLRIARFPRSFTEPLSDIYIVLVTGKFLPPSWMDRWDVGHARSRPPPSLRFTDTFSPLLIEAYQDLRLYSLVSVSGRERKSDFPLFRGREREKARERDLFLGRRKEGTFSRRKIFQITRVIIISRFEAAKWVELKRGQSLNNIWYSFGCTNWNEYAKARGRLLSGGRKVDVSRSRIL